MRIGTDLSLKECSNEGYLMMDYKARELMTKGTLNPDVSVYFFSHVPPYVEERYVGVPITLMTDVNRSANEVWETYLEDKEGIDKCCGLSHEFPTCPYSLLSLASDFDCYKNL